MGAGAIGRRHAAHVAAHPSLALAGVVDPNPAAWREDAPGFADLDAVDVAVDGVVIATPTDLHAPHVAAAAARGWPALVEKPVANTVEDADAIIATAEGAGIPILIGQHRRHHPKSAALKRLIAEGGIGRPVLAALTWSVRKPSDYFDMPWRQGRAGAPVLMNMIHDVDLLRWWLGEIVEVQGMGANIVRAAPRVESGAINLRFASGAIATIAFADCAASPWGFEAGTGENPNIAQTGADMAHFVGTEGAVAFPSLTYWTGARDWGEAPTARQIPAEGPAPLDAQLLHFADVIRGDAAPLVDAHEGKKTLEAILKVEAAVMAGIDAGGA